MFFIVVTSSRAELPSIAAFLRSSSPSCASTFVKYTRDGAGKEVDTANMVKLFKEVFPNVLTSQTVHNRLRKALDMESMNGKCLDWYGFLHLMMVYEDLAEEECERCIQDCLEDLNLPQHCVDDGQDILRRICLGAKAQPPVTAENLLFLARGIAPQLTQEEAEEALERIVETEAFQDELMGVRGLKTIVLSYDLSKRRDAKPHDLV